LRDFYIIVKFSRRSVEKADPAFKDLEKVYFTVY